MEKYYSKLQVLVFTILFILIWVVAMISIFYNIKYSLELIEKEQKVNTLIDITENLKEKLEVIE